MTFATGGVPHAGSRQASILQHSAFFTVQHSHSYMTTGKNILSNIFSYAAVGALILLLIIILPCIVRILRQNIQRLATELHLAVLRNKKGGDAGSQREELRPWQRS